MTRVVYLAVAVSILLIAGSAFAATPLGTIFTYQGQLKDGDQPVDGSLPMVFELYDADIGGNLLASDDVGTITLTDGLFTVEIDFGAGPYTTNEARWLQVVLDGTIMSPRQRLTAAPFSLATRGLNVDADGNVQGAAGVAFGNDAEIGLDSPPNYPYAKVFDFSHTLTDLSASNVWLPFQSFITLDPDSDASNLSYYGADMETLIPEGNDKDFGYLEGQYFGLFHRGSGLVDVLVGGGFVTQTLRDGHVNYQQACGAISLGGSESTITDNRGLVVATGHEGTGGAITNDYGLYIYTPYANSPLENHYGIYLEDQDIGEVNSFAIYSAGGNSYLDGDLELTGTLSKGAGSFKIDHPLDPENKFLYHSFVESPDMKNVYDGVVVLDANGEAVVELPDWFEALNRDFRYQLTCIGGFAPVYVAEKVRGNSFRIAGGTAGLEVSWQVTGIRQDAFAEANRIPVEVDKPDYARGHYQHPEAFGLSKERGIQAAHDEHFGLRDHGRPAWSGMMTLHDRVTPAGQAQGMDSTRAEKQRDIERDGE